MRLTFKHFDGRRRNYEPIIDEDSGKQVGLIQYDGVGFGGSGGIDVSLFGGKYAISVNQYDECWGFVKGVEAVLNEMTSTRTKRPFGASWSDHLKKEASQEADAGQ